MVLKQPAFDPDELDTLDDDEDADVDGFDAGLLLVLLLLLGLGLLEAVVAGCCLFATFLVSTLGFLTFRRECDASSAKALAALFLELTLGMAGSWREKPLK